MIIKIPSIFFAIALVAAIILAFVALHPEAYFNDELASRYNRTQFKRDHYLDVMHEKYGCCGVKGQRFVINHPTVFQPTKDLTVELPDSCCSKLTASNRCVYANIYPITCSRVHETKVNSFKMVVPILFGVSLLFKAFMHFAYKQSADSLFVSPE